MTTFILKRQWLELAVVIFLMLTSTPFFWFTDLDSSVSAIFFQADNPIHWQGQQWQWCQWLFDNVPKLIFLIIVIAFFIIILSYKIVKLKNLRRPAIYILAVILLGSGLMVNLVFKDHWGRPRPIHIQTFQGQYRYVPPLAFGHTEDKSFTCGHCSLGFSFFAVYFFAQRYKLFFLALALLFGTIMSVARFAVGGHFLSDALWSGYIVFLVAWLIYYGWYQRDF